MGSQTMLIAEEKRERARRILECLQIHSQNNKNHTKPVFSLFFLDLD